MDLDVLKITPMWKVGKLYHNLGLLLDQAAFEDLEDLLNFRQMNSYHLMIKRYV